MTLPRSSSASLKAAKMESELAAASGGKQRNALFLIADLHARIQRLKRERTRA